MAMVKMTDEQKYNAVLKELGEVLAEKSMTISCQSWQIDNLKEKLEAAEKEANKHAFVMRSLCEINDAIFECIDFEAGVVLDAERLVEMQSSIRVALLLENGEGGAA